MMNNSFGYKFYVFIMGFCLGCSFDVLPQGINMNQLNLHYIDKIKRMTSDQMHIFLFVHANVKDTLIPLIIEDYNLYWDYCPSAEFSGSFIDTLDAILSRKQRTFVVDSLAPYLLEHHVVNKEAFDKIVKSGITAVEVYDKYFSVQRGMVTWDMFKDTEISAAIAFLIDNNVIVALGGISGNIFISKP